MSHADETHSTPTPPSTLPRSGERLSSGHAATDRQRFALRARALNFGRFENLPFQNGIPVVGVHTRILRDIKFGNAARPRFVPHRSDAPLKLVFQDFFSVLEEAGSGIIHELHIQNGVPAFMRLEETPHEEK